MSQPASAASLLQSLDLLADGPVLWGQPVRSRAPGIFLVEMATREQSALIDITAMRTWVERVPGLQLDGHVPTPNELAARLSSFWLPGQTVLYVGRTSKSLGARTAAMFQTPLGDRRPHAGGHWLQTLQDFGALRVWWSETEAPEEYEDAVVSAIAATLTAEELAGLPEATPILPWANLETVTGERKTTGISNALLSDAEVAAASDTRPKPAASTSTRSSSTATRRAPGPAAPAPPAAPLRRAPPRHRRQHAVRPATPSPRGRPPLRRPI